MCFREVHSLENRGIFENYHLAKNSMHGIFVQLAALQQQE